MESLVLRRGVWAVAVAMIAQAQAQSFNMWPIVNATQLAPAIGISVDCMNAMNTTVTCDPDLFRMAGQIDLYLWDQDNVTDLCTSSCIQSSSDWLQGVYDACAADVITVDGKMVPVDSVAIRYGDGIGLACLADSDLTILLSQNQTNTDPPQPNSTTIISSNGTVTNITLPGDLPGNGTTIEVNNSTLNYCFLESQNWVGADPDCDSDSNSTLCTDPDAASRIANLYNDTILCSSCFLSVMWWRINSPFLPDSDYSDYLIEQYQDIQDVCNVTMPPSLVRALPSYAAAPSPTYLPPGTDPNDNSTTSTGTTCSGQTISAGSAKRDELTSTLPSVELRDLDGDHSGYARVKRAAAGSCDSLSTTYGVTTGDLQSITGTDDCSSSTGSICAPLACAVQQVNAVESCASIASSLATASFNVTTALFLQWNPNIIGLCDNVTVGQYICTGPPGGGYTLPPPINGTNTNAAGQQRGGQGSGSNPDGPDGPDGPTANSTSSAPTQLGIATNCSAFAYANANSTCYDMSQAFHITLAQLTTWNPVLGYPDGHNCTTEFWAGYDYCVGVKGSSTSSSTSTSKPASTTSALPYPTQSGIISSCNKYQEAVSGDYCYIFAQDNGITTDQLYAWNSVLGANGANCGTLFQAGYDYCVGISSTSTTPPSTTSKTPTTTPIPTQSGIASNCNKIVVAKSGDYCYIFAQDNNITTDELYAWNPVLGANGANCGTEFFAGDGYCVGVSGQTASTSTAPTYPTQSGIAKNCNKIVEAVSGDYCYIFAQDNGITTTQLYTWNPVLGFNGENCGTAFFAGDGYCVSVSS